jgi:GMP synthase-like glutamine amidotransferase
MVGDLLGEEFAYRAYIVPAGELPKHAQECDAWLVPGSAAGVYDPEPWIAPLKGFIQSASGQTPMVGICFGHQIMAEAFGGQVIKSPKGWGIGLHCYDVSRPAAWMDDVTPVNLPVSHQDQVVAVGDGAERIGGNDFTPFGMVAYPDRRALSIQAHPEFTPDYAKALIALRRGKRFEDAHADAALATFEEADDRDRVGGWISRFLKTA